MPEVCRHSQAWSFFMGCVPRVSAWALTKGEVNFIKVKPILYRVSLKKGNPSFRVHYSIIKNYFFKNVHIIGKLIFSSFI